MRLYICMALEFCIAVAHKTRTNNRRNMYHAYRWFTLMHWGLMFIPPSVPCCELFSFHQSHLFWVNTNKHVTMANTPVVKKLGKSHSTCKSFCLYSTHVTLKNQNRETRNLPLRLDWMTLRKCTHANPLSSHMLQQLFFPHWLFIILPASISISLLSFSSLKTNNVLCALAWIDSSNCEPVLCMRGVLGNHSFCISIKTQAHRPPQYLYCCSSHLFN